jgi:hypothetical protein
MYTHLPVTYDRWNIWRASGNQNITHNASEFHNEFKFYFHHNDNQQPCSLNPKCSYESRETLCSEEGKHMMSKQPEQQSSL